MSSDHLELIESVAAVAAEHAQAVDAGAFPTATVDALRRAGGNQTQAARLLDMPLRTLVHKIKSYGIQKKYE